MLCCYGKYPVVYSDARIITPRYILSCCSLSVLLKWNTCVFISCVLFRIADDVLSEESKIKMWEITKCCYGKQLRVQTLEMFSYMDRPFSRYEKKTEMKIEAEENVGGLYL